MLQGALLTRDFLDEGITQTPDWQEISEETLSQFENELRTLYERFPTTFSPNETQTEDDLIWPILERLGWNQYLRNQNLSARGRENVPDGLLFCDEQAKARANQIRIEYERYGLGSAIVESKRWLRPLDRESRTANDTGVPSTQMLRYLRRVDDLTNGAISWGILTNGRFWRLYYQRAKSVSEEFLELDLPSTLGIAGLADLFAPRAVADRRHWLKVFFLLFRRTAFTASGAEGKTFHERALQESRYWEEAVAADLSKKVFAGIEEQTGLFPQLVEAIARHDPEVDGGLGPRYLQEVRDGVFVLLYRLLFLLYAEDRDLLPSHDQRYDDYSLRKIREDIHRRVDNRDTFSDTLGAYWGHVRNLFQAVARGDRSLGIPPYNGGLFSELACPILNRVILPDAVFAPIIEALSRHDANGQRRYINYRDLSVQQLGSIYERLLEFQLKAQGGGIAIQPNIFARKTSGSYYTPDELVKLIIECAVGSLVQERMGTFTSLCDELRASRRPKAVRLAQLSRADPAEGLLQLKVCDPAMGSGHFLVSLVDYLSDRVLEAMAEAESLADWSEEPYRSPLAERIEAIRARILNHARDQEWAIDDTQLDDKHIVRRMVLKQVIYGVDKNPMAVELAKVSLWLHTFTVGAPLSFLDHHLRCGDSLFGEWVRGVTDKIEDWGGHLLINHTVQRAKAAAQSMSMIERLTDAEIAEVTESALRFADVERATTPLSALMSLIHAIGWLGLTHPLDQAAVRAWLDEQFGDPIRIALGEIEVPASEPEQITLLPDSPPAQQTLLVDTNPDAVLKGRFAGILARARELVTEERYLHWQVAFPGVWENWDSVERDGGFDAVIGNPPWDRMKLQEVEWFATRAPDIAHAATAARRKQMIGALRERADPLAADYEKAAERAEAAARVAREEGQYPFLSVGDVNLYSLFVERAMGLIRPGGMIGLLTPSGIASDKTAAPFFRHVATAGRLYALFDFENRNRPAPEPPNFFPDVDSRFKFCIFAAGGRDRSYPAATCAFFLHSVREIVDPERTFKLTSQDFVLLNPNTGTAPIFRNRRDAEITTAIYERLPVLIDRSSGEEVKVWPVRYVRMFDMTNDSNLFHTRQELEASGAYPIAGNRWNRGNEEFVPLYEGKMVQAYDHRAASVEVDNTRLHRPAQPIPATQEQRCNPHWFPAPQFWMARTEIAEVEVDFEWALGLKHVTSPTNIRSMIAAIAPTRAAGNSLPVLIESNDETAYVAAAPLLLANFNSMPLDYVLRQKVQGQNLNWFILEQLPVVPPEDYERRFGSKSAAEIVKDAVLQLTYTAHDMEPFARDLGYEGPPFAWNEEERRHLRAKLDAIYFILYGITDRDDVSYIFSTFPIVQREDEAIVGRYISRDLCLAYMNALQAGDPDARVVL